MKVVSKQKSPSGGFRGLQTLTIFKVNSETRIELPFIEEGIKAGFPSPAQDYEKQSIDINEVLIRHPASTFFARVDGDSLYETGIFNGDIVVIDKSLEPQEGNKVVAFIDGEFVMKTIRKGKDVLFLVPANPEFETITVTPDQQFVVWGVVTHVIHKFL